MIADVKTPSDIEDGLSRVIWVTRFLEEAFSDDVSHWQDTYPDDNFQPLSGASFILEDISSILLAIKDQWCTYYFKHEREAREAVKAGVDHGGRGA